MVHLFIERVSSPHRIGHVMLLSVAIHAGLLSLVIRPTTHAWLSSTPVAEVVQYMPLVLQDGPPPRVGQPHVRHRRTPPSIGEVDRSLALVLASTQPTVPETPFQHTNGPLSFDRASAAQWETMTGADRTTAGWGTGVDDMRYTVANTYIAATVDERTVAADENPKPAYPAEMLRQMVETRFSTYFVVDTTGWIDTTTIQIPPSVDPLFAKAVRDVLFRWHFIPAQVHGRRVRQLVEQPFEFRIVSWQLAQRVAAAQDASD